jgi:hypothetical protein
MPRVKGSYAAWKGARSLDLAGNKITELPQDFMDGVKGV